MYGAGESPGSIRNQIGRSLNAIRDRVEEKDVAGVADHLALLVAISSPKLQPEEREKFQIPSVEGGRDRHGERAHKLFKDCMRILAELLAVLSDRGLYSYKESELGDASGLALSDPAADA